MSNFDTIKSLIQASAIDSKDKMALGEAFAEVPDHYLESVAKLIQKDPSWVEKLNDNRKKKNEAMSAQNEALWNDILTEEKKYIEDLTYDLD